MNIEHKGIQWVNYYGAIVPEGVPHREGVTKDDVKHLLKHTNAYFCRYTSDWDIKEKTEYWYVLKDKIENLDDYKSKIRYQIRKGLKNCHSRVVSKEELVEFGYEIYFKSYERYEDKFKKPSSKSHFQRWISSMDETEWDFWGVFNDKRLLIGFSLNQIWNNICNLIYVKSHPDYYYLYPNYALFFSMQKYYLNDKGFKYVLDGGRNIGHKTNIQNFLITKFQYRKVFCKLNVIYSKRVKLLVLLLFPFRPIISKIRLKPCRKLTYLLKQEEIRRTFKW